MTTTEEAYQEAIKAISDKTSNESLFDVTIVCTTDDHQAEFWMKRLSEGICQSRISTNGGTTDSKFPLVLAVSEDWSKGGAGNGLGTLYAYEKACRKGKEMYDLDLDALLKSKEISAALFHTAGKGTRLAPLPASENNNKPGVKLPVCHKLSNGTLAPITVLEAVIQQSGIYAPSRKGRLSVFWGDQIFIPSAKFRYIPTHHADIMCTLLGSTAPTAKEWEEKGLDKYGVIAVSQNAGRDAAQVEKVDHPTAVKMLSVLGDIGQVGPSLGSFSVSAALLDALCQEYKEELSTKTGKFDTDPHFWMPLTLPSQDYITLMSQKGVSQDTSREHHARMTRMKQSFDLGGMGLFGAVDVGTDALWFDYGQIKLYLANNLKFLEKDRSADFLRQFFHVTSNTMGSTLHETDVTVDESSCVFASHIPSGTISQSVLANVRSSHVQSNGAIIVNCVAKKIVAGKNAILYNLVDTSDEGIVANDDDVLVGIMKESGDIMTLKSKTTICGGKVWKDVVEGNTMSFENVMFDNADANITAIDQLRTELVQKVSSDMGL
eukprot:CAMPEP_0184859576 /NCGR_PEP_ID=MMETSP0580-20130426/4569_1 /TAXON_ID=1118495 /ORGANISM="Dactyliosolen fragilissimus" /LENGTH=547 /DNA_ID=CAMNT_0027356299 /DNA_START=148 /DNA_END=1791 /DNA_ORIENTATION=-